MITCGKCSSTWTGLSMAHCPSCCRTFSTAGNFDRHRQKPKYGAGCFNPAKIGMVQNEHGTWKQPGEWDVTTARSLRSPSPGDPSVADGEVSES